MIDILTGTAFDATERMHHREDEVALEFPSGVSSRARGLLALRAQNWRASGGPTPPPWAPTENAYVETDGVCYIDTGWTPTPTGAYSADIRAISTASGVTGCLNSTASSRMGLQANSRAMYYGLQANVVQMTSGPLMTSRAVRAVDNVNGTIENGVDVRSFSGNNLANMPTFLVGARHYGANVDNRGAWRLWNFKGWQDGTLVCDYYPRELDGVAGLWDMVTQTFLAPIGGTLSYGISAT